MGLVKVPLDILAYVPATAADYMQLTSETTDEIQEITIKALQFCCSKKQGWEDAWLACNVSMQ